MSAKPKQLPGCLPRGYSLDSMLEPEQCAVWLQIPERELGDKYRHGKIPAAKIGHKTIRYNPRTILAANVKLAT